MFCDYFKMLFCTFFQCSLLILLLFSLFIKYTYLLTCWEGMILHLHWKQSYFLVKYFYFISVDIVMLKVGDLGNMDLGNTCCKNV